ncbi:hypothetical protein EJ04DRAFT_429327 [Polyplosphaeria fusca]|uniref:AMMECR1 domain-containing protein n=1 Tax=Polyplosphaeria fusca TaxID=682080 RepID=A0A9P4R7A5_9PLEO|nr:hypothetical protein EJ04DRAFT_429327 [Polyplosphaeria fusca]
MATEAHCAYCFETLAASLEKRPALTLAEVELWWKKYNTDDDDATGPDPADPADLEPSDEDMDDDDVPPPPPAVVSPEATLDPRPAAISRLLAPSLSSASSSSVQSTASSTPSRGASEAKSPLFVTWNTIGRSGGGGGEKRLRGCIGTFEAQELDDGLRSYALTSAFDDTRFSPIRLSELPTLECGVTLLTNFEPIDAPLDWHIGVHGLRISFAYHGRRYGSTYLPDVAKEQGWSKEETMVSLMRKAGWNGRRDDWRKIDVSVVRYQGRQVRLGYAEWREWRGWVEEEERARYGRQGGESL